MSLKRWVCCLALPVAASCASAPAHYYTLLPESAHEALPTASYRVAVEPVRIPAQVDRLELVTRLPNGGLSIVENERWVAPVADELQNALSIDLDQLLGQGGHVAGLPGGASLSVRVEVERFEAAPSRYALIEATWQVDVKADGRELRITGRSRAYQPVGGGYPELVRGYQRGVAAIARDMSGISWQPAAPGAAADCPGESSVATK